jgi:DNA polymerase-3 subunit epsilon
VKHVRLERPLAVFDLETTGTDPATDKIVEIAVLRIEPDGKREARTRRIDPGRPIPPAATAVHGIGDDDVRGEPTFDRIARGLLEFLDGADLAGFNVRRFDVPLLEREFSDCGLDLGLAGRRVVDVMTIFHRKEPRDLSAAVRFYLGREHTGAHAAEADLEATLAVLEAQFERYPDLPRTVAELDAWTHPVRDAVDQSGKFVWKDGEVTFAFGKHRGRRLADVAREMPDYLEWIAGADFPEDARALVRRALDGELMRRDQSA